MKGNKMNDPRFVNITNFNWKMNEHQLRNLRIEHRGIDELNLYVDNIALDAHPKFDTDKHITLTVQGLNRKGKQIYFKEYGVHVVPNPNYKNADDGEPKRENAAKDFPMIDNFEIVDVGMPVRWNAKPKGLIIHSTAGWSGKESDALAALKLGKKNGFTYWAMSESGKIYMDTKATEHGYHCGTRHHRDHIGLEICNGLKLKNGKTWFGYTPPANRVRTYTGDVRKWHNGEYMTFTDNQVDSLIALCLRLKSQFPDDFQFDNVLGHHEIAPDHKCDPCGALPYSMGTLREILKTEWAKIGNK